MWKIAALTSLFLLLETFVLLYILFLSKEHVGDMLSPTPSIAAAPVVAAFVVAAAIDFSATAASPHAVVAPSFRSYLY